MRTRLKIMKSMIAMKNILNLSLRGWLFAALLMTASASHAQKKQYPYLQDGKIIVCREGADGVKSSLIHPNWDSTPSHNELDAANNRFAAKFEVAASDVDTSATWDDAVNLCSFRLAAAYDPGASVDICLSQRVGYLRSLRHEHRLLVGYRVQFRQQQRVVCGFWQRRNGRQIP